VPTVTKQTARNDKPMKHADPGLSAWDFIDQIRLVVYGQSRTGKTTLWASFPGPILALVCSSGLRPGELRSVDTPENRKKITAKVIRSTEQYVKILKEEAPRFATVVLDHVGGLQDLDLKEVMGLEEVPLQRPVIGDNKATWGRVAIDVKELFRPLLNLPGHVVVVGHERTFSGNEEDRSSEVISPVVNVAVTPSICLFLNREFDFTVQTFLRPRFIKQKVGDMDVVSDVRAGTEYCLRTGAHDTFYTKFRCSDPSVLPEAVVLGRTGQRPNISAFTIIDKLSRGEAISTRNQKS